MRRRTASGANARALREFGQALRSGPFLVALAISLIAHLLLFVVIGRGGAGGGGGERRIPLMRVRLLPPPQP